MYMLSEKLTSLIHGQRLPLIACVLTDEDVSLLSAESLTMADLIELRIDMFKEISEDYVSQTVKNAKSKFNKPLISTIRDIKEGGVREIPHRLRLYAAAMPMSDFVDVEINSESLIGQIKAIPQETTILIGSYHNFDSTPEDEFLEAIAARGRSLGADIVKIAVTAQNRDDLIRLMLFTLKHREKGVITMSMGDYGMPSRIVSPVFGSLITYGYINKPSAPGQLSLSQLSGILGLIKLR